MYSPNIEKLIKLFSKFPTVGPRTAARFVFYLIKSSDEKIEELIKAIEDLKKKIKICPLCFNSFEISDNEVCSICSDQGRNRSTICIIEKEIDLEAIEKNKIYKGLYFILGGTISNLKDKDAEQEIETRIDKLIQRIKKPDSEIKEIILGLNPTIEGENTSLWLKRKLDIDESLKITQLGRGLPMGGELEYADEETLSSALEGRK